MGNADEIFGPDIDPETKHKQTIESLARELVAYSDIEQAPLDMIMAKVIAGTVVGGCSVPQLMAEIIKLLEAYREIFLRYFFQTGIVDYERFRHFFSGDRNQGVVPLDSTGSNSHTLSEPVHPDGSDPENL